MLTGPPHNDAHYSDRRKEEIVNDNRLCREVVKAMDQAQEGAATGTTDSDGPMGEAGTSHEAPGEGRTTVPLMTATGVAAMRGAVGVVLGVVEGGWGIL